MKKLDVGQTITILANIGVIGGIVFLAFEIRQNTAQMRAEAAYSIHQDVQSLNRDVYQDQDFAELILRAQESFDSLDPVEKLRVEKYFFSEINLSDFIMGLREEGIADVSFDIVNIMLRDFRSQQGRREFINSRVIPSNESGPQPNFRSEDFYRLLTTE